MILKLEERTLAQLNAAQAILGVIQSDLSSDQMTLRRELIEQNVEDEQYLEQLREYQHRLNIVKKLLSRVSRNILKNSTSS